jgi:hypothetical protein
VQRWLTLGFLAPDGTRVTLEVEVDARLVHDGVAIVSRDESELASLRFEVDGASVEREVPEVRGWKRDETRFRIGGLASMEQFRDLIASGLGEEA